jgi:hypothetical protein
MAGILSGARMNSLWGKWGPIVGSLVGMVFFAQRAVHLWKARKQRQLLARRRPSADRPPPDGHDR